MSTNYYTLKLGSRRITVNNTLFLFQMATYTPNPTLGYHAAGPMAYLKNSSYLNGLTTYGLSTGLDSLQSNYANYGGGNSYRKSNKIWLTKIYNLDLFIEYRKCFVYQRKPIFFFC